MGPSSPDPDSDEDAEEEDGDLVRLLCFFRFLL